MHKFFVNKESIENDKIYIFGDDVKHMTSVLRLRKGEEILVSDGERNEFLCCISSFDKKQVICDIAKSFRNASEPPIEITLYQGLPKSQKMDLIIQKCVEIGVVRIKPVITSRVVVKSEDRDISGKVERWRRISEEAAKQSSRGIVPYISEPIPFLKALEELGGMDLSVVPYEKEAGDGLKNTLASLGNISRVGIFIGPEGGFEENEIEEAVKYGVKPVTLGPRILRTETAGFVAATVILYELGDMGGSK